MDTHDRGAKQEITMAFFIGFLIGLTLGLTALGFLYAVCHDRNA